MSTPIVEAIGTRQNNLGELLDEARAMARERSGYRASRALLKRWESMIADGSGFVLLDDSDCIGLLLHSTDYELGFSSFLSDTGARKLPQSATISVCHVLKRARDASASNERFLLRSAVSQLRSVKSIETVAVQLSPLYELDLEGTLARTGFMSCKRVRMERRLSGRIPRVGAPPGCRIEVPTPQDDDALRSVIYHGYFSEIDGYLFPDIGAVCSDPALFQEFLSSNSIEPDASVIARVHGHPCGCVIVLSDEARQSGLIGVVAVVPGMRRRGVGRAMLFQVMACLQDHHHSHAALAVTVENRPAFSLYSSLGFEEVGPRVGISVWRRSVSRPLMIFPR